MRKAKKYKSEVKAAIHEIATGLRGVGMIDKQTMRRFDDSCLTPIHEFSAAKEIRALRERERDVSQVCFRVIPERDEGFGISKWERGKKKPAGPSLKRALLVERKGDCKVLP